MIRSNSPTHLMIALNDTNEVVGITYFNEGTGYSCGGNYLWMNCIYVKPKEQKNGVGTSILEHVESWAREKKLIP